MLLAALLLAQLLFYSIPLVLVKKPFFTLVVEWVASIQYRGVSLLLLLVPAALPSHSQTCVLVFYLQICILRSLTTLGIAITWVRVFPLQKHATLINSLLVNASVLLLSFPPRCTSSSFCSATRWTRRRLPPCFFGSSADGSCRSSPTER